MTHILEVLKSGEFVSGELIAKLMKISRAGVHKKIRRLREIGYKISGANRSGYMLISRPDLVNSDELEHFFKRDGISGYAVYSAGSVSSTQEEAKKIADSGKALPAVCVAERQTGSYGRMRRRWYSPAGGLWFSLALKPDIPPERVPQLTFLAAIAVCRAVESKAGIQPVIKWPNDVLIESKKFAGILTEMSAEVGKLHWVVIGVGINVNNPIPEEVSGTAANLSAAAGKKIERAGLLSVFLKEFDGLYKIYASGGFGAVKREYDRRSFLKGAFVRVDTGAEVKEGLVSGIDGEGRLLLRAAGGRSDRIIAGDIISVRKR